MGYPAGVRENGGQYTHGSLWLPMALARQGDGERAAWLMRLMNPIEHAREPEDVERYKVEPYVVAADVYRLHGRVGQGGWTWYTGSAGWMYRIWVEEILGLKIEAGKMTISPVIPPSWDSFSLRYRFGESIYEIKVENPDQVSRGVVSIELDGEKQDQDSLSLEAGGGRHTVLVRMGSENN
jgi:cyclic beta-1,2-glucan synthetase